MPVSGRDFRFRIEFPLTDGSPCALGNDSLYSAKKFARRLSAEGSEGGNWWRIIDTRSGRRVADSETSL